MQPETVSRCFKGLEDRGIIALTSIPVLKVLDRPLRRIANGDRNTNNLRHTAEDKFASGF